MSKRLIFLTRANIIIFLFALVALLHRLDAADLEEDIRALDLLQSVAAQDVSQAFVDGSVYTRARLWLENHDPTLAEQNRQARQRVTDLLGEVGVQPETLAQIKGQAGFTADMFQLLDFPVAESSLQLQPGVATAQGVLPTSIGVIPGANVLGRQALDTASQSVDELIDRFLAVTEPLSLTVAVSLADTGLPNLAGHQTSCPAILQSVTLSGNVVTARFEEPASAFDPSSFVQQQPLLPCSFTEELAVVTQQVQAPSLYDFLSGSVPDPEVGELRANPELLGRLQSVYGRIKFSLAQQIAAEDFAQAYKSIDIFGFTISTRRFPFAVLLLSVLVAWAIAWTVELARRSGQHIITGKSEEDVVDILLDLAPLRTVIWVVLPLLAILASLPLFPLSRVELIVTVAGAALCVLLGGMAALRARAL
jgi:hypothetical protein